MPTRQHTSSGTTDNAGMESLGRGLHILNVVSAEGAVTVEHLADAVDLPLSTVYRYVRYLRETAYLAEVDGLYMPGTKAGAGMAGRDAAHLVQIASPLLHRLHRTTGAAAILTVRIQLAALTLDRVLPASHSPLSFRRGLLRPLYAGASATALLAWAPESVIDRVVRSPIRKITAATPSGPDLVRELESIRIYGYVVSHGEVDPLMSAIGAPVLRSETCICAVSVAGPTCRLAGRHLDKVIAETTGAASLLRSALASRAALQAWDGSSPADDVPEPHNPEPGRCVNGPSSRAPDRRT